MIPFNPTVPPNKDLSLQTKTELLVILLSEKKPSEKLHNTNSTRGQH